MTSLASGPATFGDGFETGDLSRWTSVGGLTVQGSTVYSGAFAARATTTGSATYAQKTISRQENRNLLLSEAAIVDSKPTLEIHNDDVKCNHGSTIGQLDEEALFYLRARGIGADEARNLLVYAFAADVLETIEQADVRESLERITLERFVAVDEAVPV